MLSLYFALVLHLCHFLIPFQSQYALVLHFFFSFVNICIFYLPWLWMQVFELLQLWECFIFDHLFTVQHVLCYTICSVLSIVFNVLYSLVDSNKFQHKIFSNLLIDFKIIPFVTLEPFCTYFFSIYIIKVYSSHSCSILQRIASLEFFGSAPVLCLLQSFSNLFLP